ncbi:unnamed protein product, partial [marine sediment metagenome]
MVLPASSVTANTNDLMVSYYSTEPMSKQAMVQNIIWDNGMDYIGLGAAQLDDQYPFEAECADDFIFNVSTEVCDVHWIGGYWNGDDYNIVHWPWEITFYYDDGTGERPGQIYLGPFVFDDTQYTEVLLEDTGTTIFYEFSVDLLENYLFPP